MSTIGANIVSDHEDNPPTDPCNRTDDYSRLATGKEKKKVQNRLAQRTYRRRLKAKIEELQEKVKAHEQQVQELTKVKSCNSTLASTTLSTVEDVPTCPDLATRQGSAISVDFFISSLATPPPGSVGAAGHSSLTWASTPDDIDNGSPPHEAEVLDQTVFPNTDDSAINYSPSTPSCAWNPPHRSHGPQGLLTPVASSSASEIPAAFGMEGALYPPQSLYDSSSNKDAQNRFTECATDVPREDTQWNVDAAAPTRDRVRYIMAQAAAVGFDTLDEAIAAYYTGMFEDTSLGQDQRLSRNRRLPQLLSILHNASKGWSEWERRGFQEQITLGAEEILVEELNAFIAQTPMDTTSDEPANNDLEGEQLGSRRDVKERRKVQDDVTSKPLGSDNSFASKNQSIEARHWPRHSACYHREFMLWPKVKTSVDHSRVRREFCLQVQSTVPEDFAIILKRLQRLVQVMRTFNPFSSLSKATRTLSSICNKTVREYVCATTAFALRALMHCNG